MFEIEQIRKYPRSLKSTEWKVLNQKVLRSVEYKIAPSIFGDIDIVAN